MARAISYPETRKHKLNPGEEGFRLLLRIYRSNAKKRSREFTLTEEEFGVLTKSNCHYCGVIPSTEMSNHNIKNAQIRGRGAYVYNGIDRKDSSQGYTVVNSLPCCRQCNVAKMDTPYEEFISYLSRLTSFRKGF